MIKDVIIHVAAAPRDREGWATFEVANCNLKIDESPAVTDVKPDKEECLAPKSLLFP